MGSESADIGLVNTIAMRFARPFFTTTLGACKRLYGNDREPESSTDWTRKCTSGATVTR